MRLISYQSDDGSRVAAAVHDGKYFDLNRADPALPSTMIELLAGGPEMLRRAEAAIAERRTIAGRKRSAIGAGAAAAEDFWRRAELRRPCPRDGKRTARRAGDFQQAANGRHGTWATDRSAERSARKVDYEAELVVVIGRGGRHIRREAAMEHVAGYCCGHDVSARDWQHQKPGGQWLLGKSFDTFGPFGPELVTADEIPDPGNLHIQLRINGRTMQDSSTRQLIFSVAELIAYISGVCTLEVGDIIFTGTPPGVGAARRPPVFLQPGDVVEVEIEKIGVLRNPVDRRAAG